MRYLTASGSIPLVRERLDREVVRPGLLLAVYGTALLIALPEGINRRFVLVLTLAACAIVGGAVLVSIWGSLRRAQMIDTPRSFVADETGSRWDVLLLLLPMAPVVQYMLVNRDSLSLLGGFVATSLLATLAALFTLIVPRLVQGVMSRTVAMMVGLALSFVLYNMAAFARSNRWHGLEDAILPFGVFSVLVIGGVALYRYRREGTYAIAVAYFISMLVLVPFASEAITSTGSQANQVTDEEGARAKALATIAESQVDRLPDIIFLTYDAYVEDETMRQYGIDNKNQESYLESMGFEIERGTYTIGGDSIESMGRVLGGATPGEGVAGGGPLLDALRDAGYWTVGVFRNDYFFSKAEPRYDEYSPSAWPSYMTMLRGILEGRFRHDLAFSPTPHDEFVGKKREALTSGSAAPHLIYAHSGPGHSQFSGSCLDDETAQFEGRLATANQEMRDDIETILEHRPSAIVIVNGDHGPYLTKNCWGLQHGDYEAKDVTRLDIQDRFGSFLAIRWPDGRRPPEMDIDVLQDVMPAVLHEVFPGVDSDALRGSTRLAEGQERVIAGVSVEDGIIVGGLLDGSPLFEDDTR